MEKKTIVIIFGGHSAEYYVSCMSAANVISNIDLEKYDVEKLGITEDGKWFLTQASAAEIHDGKTWLTKEDNRTAVISPNRDEHKLYVFDDGQLREKNIDGVFCVIHGTDGEDGKVLELRVAEGDMGKVIGRQGRIAKEIRTIIKTVAQRTGEKVTVEIVD